MIICAEYPGLKCLQSLCTFTMSWSSIALLYSNLHKRPKSRRLIRKFGRNPCPLKCRALQIVRNSLSPKSTVTSKYNTTRIYRVTKRKVTIYFPESNLNSQPAFGERPKQQPRTRMSRLEFTICLRDSPPDNALYMKKSATSSMVADWKCSR
jgi:hypothetical protein